MSSAPTEITTQAPAAQVLTKEIRERLKQIAFAELEQLPDLLGKMQPKDRVQYTLKLLSYVAPTVREVGMYEGEPFNLEEAIENMKRETQGMTEKIREAQL